MDKVLVVGVGNMGEAIISGMLKSGLFKRENIYGLERSSQRASSIEKELGIRVFLDPSSVFECVSPSIVLLCVKPQVMDEVLSTLRDVCCPGILFITIAAGLTTLFIEKGLWEGVRVVRVMPNTPATIGEGISAISPGRYATKEDVEATYRIFSAIGEVVMVDEEMMDVVTGLSGSGPAYIFKVIDALCEGGVRGGLPKDISLRLAAKTTLGAARLLIESGESPDELCRRVASPGGTTIEGLKVLDKGGLNSLIIEAVIAATRRSKELCR